MTSSRTVTTGPSSLRVAAVLVLCAGCSSDVAPVSGRVTLDGQPLPGAVVTFQPKSSRVAGQASMPGSVGRTDQEGRYALRLIQPDRTGAAVGEHSVSISAVSGGSEESPPTGPILPRQWTDGSQRFQVPEGGTREADFAIVSSGKAGKKGAK